jgi:PPM family protein phosphatase
MKNNLQTAAASDPGKQRDNNEDRFIAQQLWHENAVLLAAIDGVGGYDGGEVAAEKAHDTVIEYLSRSANGERTQLIREAMAEANNRVYGQSKTDLALSRMSCVLTVAVADVQKQLVYFGHVGDTRLYRYRAGLLTKLSRDHSLVGYREEIGALTEAEAMNHPQRNEISRSLGSDLHGPNDANFIDTGIESFLPNDILLLCSDGLTDMITSRQITVILEQPTILKQKVEALIAAANEAGGKDNITVVLASYSQAVEPEKENVIVAENTNNDQKIDAVVGSNTIEPAMLVAENTSNSTKALHLVLAGLVGFALGSVLIWTLFGKPQTNPPTPNTETRLRDSLSQYRDSLKVAQDSIQLKTLRLDSLEKKLK